MNEIQVERLVKSFEQIAESLGDLCVIQKRRYDRKYPDHRKPREAVISRIKTEEDLAKERQGSSSEPIGEWLGGYEEPEFIGVRERAFLEEQKKRDASAQAESQAGQDAAGTKAPRRKGRPPNQRPPA